MVRIPISILKLSGRAGKFNYRSFDVIWDLTQFEADAASDHFGRKVVTGRSPGGTHACREGKR